MAQEYWGLLDQGLTDKNHEEAPNEERDSRARHSQSPDSRRHSTDHDRRSDRHRDDRHRDDRHSTDRDRRSDRHRDDRDDRDRDRHSDRHRDSDRDRHSDRYRESDRHSRSSRRSEDYYRDDRYSREKERERRSSRRGGSHRDESDRRSSRDHPAESEEDRKKRIKGEERRSEREKMENALTESERAQMKLDREERTVFVSNLPIRCHEEDLYDFFNQAGKVRDVRLIMEKGGRKSKGVGYVEYWERSSVPSAIQLTNKTLLGYAVQVAPTLAEKNRIFAQPVKKAPQIPMPIKSPHLHYTNPNTVGGATATTPVVVAKNIHPPVPPTAVHATSNSNQIPETRLYVGSLHFNVTEHQLMEIFSKYGPIEFINLHRDPETHRSKGFCFVQFRNLDDAKRALAEVNGRELLGREMKVNMVTSNASSANHGNNHSNNITSAHNNTQNGTKDTQTNPENQSAGIDLDYDDSNITLRDQGSRQAFMQKLLRPQEAQSMPVPLKPTTAQPSSSSSSSGAQAIPPKIPAPSPSSCVLLKNMFDPETETEPNWVEEIREDVAGECRNFGEVLKVGVDPATKGFVYVKFQQINHAQAAINSLHGRWFAGKQITAEFFPQVLFDQHFK